eukprot:2236762-Karenia_brevis.AAC.1
MLNNQNDMTCKTTMKVHWFIRAVIGSARYTLRNPKGKTYKSSLLQPSNQQVAPATDITCKRTMLHPQH